MHESTATIEVQPQKERSIPRKEAPGAWKAQPSPCLHEPLGNGRPWVKQPSSYTCHVQQVCLACYLRRVHASKKQGALPWKSCIALTWKETAENFPMQRYIERLTTRARRQERPMKLMATVVGE